MGPDERPHSYLEHLERQREELLANIEAHPLPEIDQITYGSQAEAATDVFEQQRELSLLRHLEAQLREVEDAIRRARQGTHGLCEACGRPIPPERLEILPEARLCVDCQRKQERRR
jgi:RNA polymerase-binding transcription factor DksA